MVGGAVPGWRSGSFIWPDGRTKLVVLGGIGSKTGDAEMAFGGLARYLASHGGYDTRRDLLEATYAGSAEGDTWRPRPYRARDTKQSLAESAEAVASTLEWYRAAFPAETRFCLVGYSLGGVAAFDGATLAMARDRAGWQGRIGAVVAIAAPIRGCNAGELIKWAWLVTPDLDPLGAAAEDLDRRWLDPAEQQRVERRAAFLRQQGVNLLTLADPDDAIVRPEEALLPAPGQSPEDLLVRAQRRRPGTLGHGAILDDLETYRRVLRAVGPQARPPAAGDPEQEVLDAELQVLKERLRREGRLRD